MAVLIVSAVSFVVGIVLFGHMMVGQVNYDSGAWMILLLVASFLIAGGVVAFCYQLKQLEVKRRIKILKKQDFFYANPDGSRSRLFDFEAFLTDLGARDVGVSYKDSSSWVWCKFGRYHYRLSTSLIEGDDGKFNAITEYAAKCRDASISRTGEGAKVLIRDSEHRQAVFDEEIFRLWRREVKRAAKHYKDDHFSPFE